MKKVLFLFLAMMTFNSFAISSFWIGAGTMTHNFLSAQNNVTGSTKVVEFAPTVLAGTTFPFFFSGLYFSPGLGYAKFLTNDNTTKNEYIIQYHFTHSPSAIFQFRYGFSNYITKLSGDGGTVVLSNGNGTATYYTPSETVTSYTASADIAGDFIFSSNWTARIQFSLMRFLSTTSRRVSNIITVNYFF